MVRDAGAAAYGIVPSAPPKNGAQLNSRRWRVSIASLAGWTNWLADYFTRFQPKLPGRKIHLMNRKSVHRRQSANLVAQLGGRPGAD